MLVLPCDGDVADVDDCTVVLWAKEEAPKSGSTLLVQICEKDGVVFGKDCAECSSKRTL